MLEAMYFYFLAGVLYVYASIGAFFLRYFPSAYVEKPSAKYEKLIIGIAEDAAKNRRMINGIYEPLFPDLNKDQETLLGIDSNHDGIRDDIELWINRKYKADEEIMAAKNYARTFKDILLFENVSQAKAWKFGRINVNAKVALDQLYHKNLKFSTIEILSSDYIDELTYNTVARATMKVKFIRFQASYRQ